MRDYAAISKRLRRYSENCVAYKLDADFADAVSDAADAIEELLDELTTIRKQFPRWISVEERLPEQFICVFATDGEDVGIAAFQGFIDDYPVWSNAWNLEYIEDQYDEDFLQVTHWMPLPAPPKGVE